MVEGVKLPQPTRRKLERKALNRETQDSKDSKDEKLWDRSANGKTALAGLALETSSMVTLQRYFGEGVVSVNKDELVPVDPDDWKRAFCCLIARC